MYDLWPFYGLCSARTYWLQTYDIKIPDKEYRYFRPFLDALSVNAYTHLLSFGTSPAVMEYIASDVNSSESLKAQFPALLSQ